MCSGLLVMKDNYDSFDIVITMLQGCASTVLLGVVPSCSLISIDGRVLGQHTCYQCLPSDLIQLWLAFLVGNATAGG